MKRLLPVLLIVGVLVGVAWSWREFETAKTTAESAAINLSSCRQLSNSIKRLDLKPEHALLGKRSEGELATRIERAIKQANIPLGQLSRIHPLGGRRIEDSSYLEQPTSVEIRSASLPSIMQFLEEMLADDRTLHITSLRLSLPRQHSHSEKETWDVEITLTHLVFSPQSA